MSFFYSKYFFCSTPLGYVVDVPAVRFVDEVPFQLSPRKLTTLKKEYIIGAAASRVHSVVFSETSMFTWGLDQGQLGTDMSHSKYERL